MMKFGRRTDNVCINKLFTWKIDNAIQRLDVQGDQYEVAEALLAIQVTILKIQMK